MPPEAFVQAIPLTLPPEDIYSRLAPHLPWLQWLDGANSNHKNERRSIWVWNPTEICVPPEWQLPHSTLSSPERAWKGEVRRCENPFSHIQQSLKKHKKKEGSSYSGWFGLAGYELGLSLLTLSHPLPSSRRDGAGEGKVFWFGRYDNALCYDHSLQKYFLCVSRDEEKEAFLSWIAEEPKSSPHSNIHLALFPKENRDHYRNQISRIRDEIVRGNVYQTNYTTGFEGKTDFSAQEIFKSLRKKSPVPYAALWNTGECFVLSLSPELFLKGQGDMVLSRPIKGTVARAEGFEEDEERKKNLLNSEKDRAELLMIVDLVRNDLGRVCVPGSVQVPELFGVESYSTVHHLVSTVQGVLASGQDMVSVFCALFPAGSIVGTPKIAAARLIAELEKDPRRFYTGSAGYFLDSGECLFSVAIRTFTMENGLFTARSGGGIVMDSETESEYEELCAKVGYLFSGPL